MLALTGTACALEDRAAERFVVPSLREQRLKLDTRVRARSASFGPWTVRRITDISREETEPVYARFEAASAGTPMQRQRLTLQLEHETRAEIPPVVVSCETARRRGRGADLASVGEDPGGEVAIACRATLGEITWTLRASGELSGNVRGRWERDETRDVAPRDHAPPTGSGAVISGDVEVLLHHRMWQAVPMRTPAPIVQFFASDRGAHADGEARRAIAATVLGGRGPTWIDAELADAQVRVAAAWLGAFMLLEIPWEQAT